MQLTRFLRVPILALVPLAIAACTSSGERGSSTTTSASSTTGGTTATTGAGGALPYPAFSPDFPQVVNGGTVMTNPKIVNVSFPSDPLEADIDAFSTAIGTTSYWGDRTAEYGIAPLVPIARIHDTFVPAANITDSDIQKWLVGQLDGTHAEYPAPDKNTLYALYYPPGVTIAEPQLGTSCVGFHGYHGSTKLADGTPVIYAVISRCPSIPEDPTATGIRYISAIGSHEIIEALTDPLIDTIYEGYASTDKDHLAYALAGLSELGDMCTLVGGAFYTPTDFPYLVQRIWSNKTALQAHDPCLPSPAGQAYFNSAPVLNDSVSFNVGGFVGKTKGVLIPVGETKTVELDLFSDAPTPSPWTVAVKERGGSNLDFSLDKTQGQNGDKIMLSIHVKAKNPAYGSEIFVVQSSLGTARNLWVGLVGN